MAGLFSSAFFNEYFIILYKVEQLQHEKMKHPSQDTLWPSGYYHGRRARLVENSALNQAEKVF